MLREEIYGFTTIIENMETGRKAGIYPHGTKVVLALRYLHEDGELAFVTFDDFVEAYSAGVYYCETPVKTYRVVITNWWQEGDPERWPDGLEPDGAVQRVLTTGIQGEARAREIARGWNATHNPGRLSTRAEIERE